MKPLVPILLAAAVLPLVSPAKADLQVRLPYVEFGELEFRELEVGQS